MLRSTKFLLLLFPISFLLFGTCRKDPPVSLFKTRHVVLVSIDGPRWSETWGDSAGRLIPHRATEIAPLGVMLNNFNNLGYTYTSAGHTAMLTGFYQSINNSGTEHTIYPNFFQYWLEMTRLPKEKAWVISSKDKIAALTDCLEEKWAGKYLPSSYCGVNGAGSGFCHDSITLQRALSVFAQHHPALCLVHFSEPDVSGHSGNWNNYLAGIRSTDNYLAQLWNFLQQDPEYAGKTTLIVTNDHGRHPDQVSNGFISHGDGCAGCRHIELLAVGPDFKTNTVLASPYEQKDIAPTIAYLMGFDMPFSEGKVMKELFR
ncbi:MAG: sulfatase [Bacteroidetes bacterium]|nr:MAG: sulfatase [Bacteroidota bacterium]